MKDLRGRCAIVTGASRGLGVYIARTLAREGMNVVLAARSASELQQVAERVEQQGGRAIAVPGDVADSAFRRELVTRAEAEFGAIDVLVNNAGISNHARYHEREAEEIDRMVAVNLQAPMLLTRLVLPGMVERGRGHVVQISSLAGRIGAPYNPVYSATKAAQLAFSHALRFEYHGTGVGFSAVCPGFVRDTGMFHNSVEKQGRRAPRAIGSSPPQKVADAVLFAIQHDRPEIYVNMPPLRPLFAIGETSPRLREYVARKLGLVRAYRRMVEAKERGE